MPGPEKLDLDRLRQKDAAEFTRLVRQYERFVMGLCQTLGLSAADREDAAAETFAMVYRGLPTFRGEAQLSTWIYRIAYRTALKVRRRYPAGVPEVGEKEDGAAVVPGAAAEEQEMHAAVWEAVARLDGDQAAAVEMFYRRGMAIEEVAAVMEKPVGTVKTLLFRGRERLRMLLKAMESAR